MGMKGFEVLILFLVLVIKGCYVGRGVAVTVSYDDRAIVIDGQRRVLLSGSIHYPRSTPEVWPELIRKSKEGGLDVIETYVFWNNHEPVKGQYYFEGRFDLVRFVKMVQEAGLYVHLRIGPYACAEWNYGGFPLWLHFIPGIQFRTTNTPFKIEMKLFLTKIVSMMKEEKLFASQGGPIILSQVENEYGNVEWAYGIGGELYVKWAAETAVSLNTTVPWVMCAQVDAPDPIINTCNGFYCDEFTPNSPSKPKMWTENYVGWFLAFGYPYPYRPSEDLAFSVARFFGKGGTFQNYYMYFGGTNWGRTAGGPLVATSYDYDAPIDEYGFIRQPKWGHLRDLHKAIKLCEGYLVSSDPTFLATWCELRGKLKDQDWPTSTVKVPTSVQRFFLILTNVWIRMSHLMGSPTTLPAWSVSILPDCKNVVYNTAKIVSQKSLGHRSAGHTMTLKHELPTTLSWSWYKEKIGVQSEYSFTSPSLLEQINTTKDISDFLWYTTSVNIDEKLRPGETKEVILSVESLGHAALIFVNNKVVGFGYGNHDDASFSFNNKIHLSEGNNTLAILSMVVGIQNYGPWFDIAGTGIFSVFLVGLNTKKDLSSSEWTYQVGLEGEHLGLDKSNSANSSLWTSGNYLPIDQYLLWYKTSFIAPEGKGPLSLNLASMGKGEAWVNGQSIGRYWSANLAPSTGCNDTCDYRGTYNAQKCNKNCGQPAQIWYHVPRSWVHSGENLLVLHEELGGNPSKITVVTRTDQDICSYVSESDPPSADSWEPNSEYISLTPQVRLSCEQGWHISSINFASYGTPSGQCGNLSHGICHTQNALKIVQEACIGQKGCSVPVSAANLGDPCLGVVKSLAVEAVCTH